MAAGEGTATCRGRKNLRRIEPPFLAATVAIVLTVLAVATLDSIQPANATHNSLPEAGIDPVVAGNGARTLGPNEGCAGVNVGDTFDVDFYVKDIPSPFSDQGGGLSSFEGDIRYDPALLRVTGARFDLLLASGPGGFNPFSFSNSVPDTDGSFHMAVVDLSLGYDWGSGVLARLTFVALANGKSALTTGNTAPPNDIPVLGDASSHEYSVANFREASVSIGSPCQGATPGPSASPTATPAPTTGFISGTIADNNGNPLGGAVWFSPSSCLECTVLGSNATGGAYQAELPPGNYIAHAILPDYMDECWTDDGGSFGCATFDAITLAAGDSLQIDFNLGRMTFITGVVRDSQGTALRDVKVTTTGGSDTTGEDGSYRVGASDGETTVGAAFLGSAPLYWTPDGMTSDVSQATRFDVANGTDQLFENRDFVVPVPTVISGDITGPDGYPAGGKVEARLIDCGLCAPIAVQTLGGHFIMANIPPGDYVLSFQPNNSIGRLYWTSSGGDWNPANAEAITAQDGTIFDAGLTVPDSVAISGLVLDGRGRPATGTVSVFGPGCPCQTTIEPDGTFAFPGSGYGNYIVRAQATGYSTFVWTPDGGSQYSQHAATIPLSGPAAANINFKLRRGRCLHDTNGDGIVTILDVSRVAVRMGAAPGDPNWAARADVDGNNRITFLDVSLVARTALFGLCHTPDA